MKIFQKFLITIVALSVVPLLTFTMFTQNIVRQELYKENSKIALEQLKNIDIQVNSLLKDVQYDVMSMSLSHVMKYESDDEFTNFLDADEDTFVYNILAEEQKIIDVFSRYRHSHPHVNSVYYGTVNGAFVRSHKRARSTQYDPRARIWYELAISDPGTIQLTPPYKSVTTDDLNIGTVSTVHDEQGQVLGVMGMDVTLSILSKLTTEFVDYGEPYNIIISDQGVILSHPDKSLLMKDVSQVAFELPREKASEDGLYIIEDQGLRKAIFVYASELTGWSYYRIVPVEQIYEVAAGLRASSRITLGLLLLAIILITLRVARIFSRRIWNISEAMAQVGTGNYSVQVTDNVTDEIGDISKGFNSMVSQIKEDHYRIKYTEMKTNLINRERLVELMLDSRMKDGLLIQVSISNFLLISQIHGHATGEDMMSEVADRLKSIAKEGSVLAMVADTNFVYYCRHGWTEHDLESFIKEIRQCLARSYVVDKHHLIIEYRIGLIDMADEDMHPEEILINLNLTTHSHDNSSGAAYEIYDKRVKDSILENLTIEKEIIYAIDRQEMYPVFQPIVRTDTGDLYGFETLARWHNKELGGVYPDKFIPIAEKTKAIIPIGKYIMEEAMKFGLAYEKRFGTAVAISVNISLIQVYNDDFLETVDSLIHKYGFDPKNLIFELTETVFYSEEAVIIRSLKALSEKGIRIALDDFGSGYSSINNLIAMPVDYLKIDRALMWKSMEDDKGMAMIELIMDYARKINMDVIIEGVEDEAMVHRTKELHIPFSQGYHYSKPKKAKELLK